MPQAVKVDRSAIEKHLRILDAELISAQKSWLLFENSTKHFSDAQSTLINTVTVLGITEPFEHIQKIALYNVVSTLCRMYDSAGPDRICFKQLISELDQSNLATQSPSPKELEAMADTIFRSEEFQELKRFRNAYVGHRLKQEQSATYKFIPAILARTYDLLIKSFDAADHTYWKGQPTVRGIDCRAELFFEIMQNTSINKNKGNPKCTHT